ncbi:hypothetical protein PINS_up017537 [Pythium insidiosum]|nr:hypothetical protein PINS_up017537 [Pythium insidiosum]
MGSPSAKRHKQAAVCYEPPLLRSPGTNARSPQGCIASQSSMLPRRNMLWLFGCACMVLLLHQALALCPNACSGHGVCDRYKVCRCQEGYFGHDCSLRRCPRGKAWGVVSGVNNAHSSAECSGRGICSYDTGTCNCQEGFTGNACQLINCPDGCSTRGRCITMQQLAEDEVLARELNDKFELRYDAVWDADILRGCKCDPDFYGANCALKKCPVGDDPLTTGQVNEVQLISCQTTYTQQVISLRSDIPLTRGTFRLHFGSQYTRPISFQALGELDTMGTSVANSLRALTGVTGVSVTRVDTSATQADWLITFPAANPRQNALIPRWKMVEVQQFVCAADSGTFSVTFANQTVRGIPFNADINTFKNALFTVPFIGDLDVSFNGVLTICSTDGTFVTIAFRQLWHRDLFGDVPPLTFSRFDTKGATVLFLNGGDGFIDVESKEVIKGIDTCRVIEQQSIECSATSGQFALVFEGGTRVANIPFSISAANLRTMLISAVSYIVDLDVSYSSGRTAACSTEGTVITISFVVVKSTGARGDGDLAEVTADATNGGNNGLSHISNRLRLASTFTEVQRGATCVDFDQTFTDNPRHQMSHAVTQGGGSFTVSFRGATSSPIPASVLPTTLQSFLERMPTIKGVQISYTGAQACETPVNVMRITFTQDFGNLPTLTVDGSLLVAGSSISAVGAGAAIGAVVSVDGTKESDVCSNRGMCEDLKLGRCYCYLGYTSSNGNGTLGNAQVNRGDCGATSRIPIACPGELACSGHGVCSGTPSFRCACQMGWQSGDCSERTCPLGLSWFDYPVDTNVAHRRMTECSSVGSCDRSNGLCKCPRPYTGPACEFMSCGGAAAECSGNGRCLALNDLAPLVTVNGELGGYSYGNDPNDPLTWDHRKIRSCLCDPGFFGFDCSLRECPRGDDPNTYDDTVERQLLQCIATAGTFTLTFRDQTTPSIPFNANAAAIKAALEGVVADLVVDVSFVGGTTACSTGNTLVVIDFSSELGSPPALKASRTSLRDAVNGNGQDGSGTIVVATGGTTLLGQNSIKGTRERAFCSHHGKCDFSTGLCSCDKGWASSNGKGGPGPIGDCGYRLERRGGD